MGERLAIIAERSVAFRRGLESSLTSAGFDSPSPPDAVAWAAGHPGCVAVVTLRDSEACDLIDEFVAAGASVVALLPEPTLDAFMHAFRHGAVSAVDWNVEPDAIVAVVSAASDNLTLLPSHVTRSLAQRGSNSHGPVLGHQELEWLLSLSTGRTVVDLADEVGYSERSMFRKLHDLYEKLGVQNRAAAIIEAQRLGLLDGDRTTSPAEPVAHRAPGAGSTG